MQIIFTKKKWSPRHGAKHILLIILLTASASLFSQRYNFSNFAVEQGLVQSQVSDIMQDKTGNLWIATFGGISRFDGRDFHNYYPSDGLLTSLVYRVFTASNGIIWAGTEEGLQSFDGKQFHTHTFSPSLNSKIIIDINESEEEGIVVRTAADELLSLSSKQKIFPSSKDDLVTAINCDKQKKLYAAVFKKGIYKLQNKEWRLVINNNKLDDKTIVQQLFFDSNDNLWLLTNLALYKCSNDSITKIISHKDISSSFRSLAEDAEGNIWLGTTRGAYIISPNASLQYIGSTSGLADITIYEILKDREGNLWFATDGEGLFRLSNSPVFTIDKTSGLTGNVVMGVVMDENKCIWAGTMDGGLLKSKNGRFEKIIIPSAKAETQKINALLFDSKKQLWAGTLGGGLWRKNLNNKWTEILTENGHPLNAVFSMHESSDKTIWVVSSSGILFFQNNILHKLNTVPLAFFSITDLDDSSVVAGSADGLWKISNKKNITRLRVPGIKINSVNCFAGWKNYLALGTDDKGIILWDIRSGHILQCNSKDGLASDFIFSIYTDSSNIMYAGTGHGISKIMIDEKAGTFTVQNFSAANTVYGPECNLNVVQKDTNGNLMFGTTRGLAVLNPSAAKPATAKPLIFLNSVKLFSKNIDAEDAADTITAWNTVPKNLSLDYTQNHLTFEFNGIYLTNPGSLKYKYRLEGLDSSYSELVSASKVIYSNLQPGQYHFKAIAVAENGLQSSNMIDFPFEIKTPFFQKTWFRAAVILLLVFTGALIQYARTKLKNKRMEALTKARLDEQQKIQERISEDLHDDLGNTITRITILSDVLSNKITDSDEDKKKIVRQIKENAQSLYLGTKDIIWSLTPGYGSLYDIIERCSDFGIHLFEETNIEFITTGQDIKYKQVNVPILINRNLMMIVKEALTNILKHAGAAKAIFDIRTENDMIYISVSDNGKGIQQDNINTGNGLQNMQKRIVRIGGTFKIKENNPEGTTVEFSFKIPPSEG